MATIITVHGTFASGPDHGDQWWQAGSTFERDMRALVEGADGRLDFTPHVWDGLNSETSRRAAGVALAQRLDELDRRGERYCVIGHSHGGSVIASALIRSAHSRTPRSGLSRWLTVGTPFVGFARKRLLFTRLGVLGRAGYVSLLTYFVLTGFAMSAFNNDKIDWVATLGILAVFAAMFAVAFIVLGWDSDRRLEQSGAVLPFQRQRMRYMPRLGLPGRLVYLVLFSWAAVMVAVMFNEGRQHEPAWLVTAFVLGIVPLAAFHILAFWLPGLATRWFGKAPPRRRDLVEGWSKQWLAFRHPADEAVEGLRQLPQVSFPIFGTDFAAAPMTFASVMALPVLVTLAIFTPEFMAWLHTLALDMGTTDQQMFGQRPFNDGNDIANNAALIQIFPMVVTSWLFSAAITVPALVFGFFIFGPIVYFLGAILLVTVARGVSTVASGVVSRFLDRLAWRQIRASAYGCDAQGEVARAAGDAPAFAQACAPLPKTLCDEITRVADEAAASAIPKLRLSLNRLAFAEDGRARSDLVSDYLTWDELIHTAYFKVPLFVKLTAYAIAHSDGFRPSQRFLADPDYARVAGIYADMQPNAGPLPGPR